MGLPPDLIPVWVAHEWRTRALHLGEQAATCGGWE